MLRHHQLGLVTTVGAQSFAAFGATYNGSIGSRTSCGTGFFLLFSLVWGCLYPAICRDAIGEDKRYRGGMMPVGLNDWYMCDTSIMLFVWISSWFVSSTLSSLERLGSRSIPLCTPLATGRRLVATDACSERMLDVPGPGQSCCPFSY